MFFWKMRESIDRTPRAVSVLRSTNDFVSGREIGDEARYILERRDRKIFPGNLLPRPGLVLNPWSLRDSRSGLVSGKGGGALFGEERKRAERSKDGDGSIGEVADEESFVNLDFLPIGSRSFYNLRPDEDGVVEIDLDQLGGARFIRAVAIDGSRIATAELALPVQRLETRERRLKKIDQLDPKGRFTRGREAQLLQAGERLTIERSNAARWRADILTSGKDRSKPL